jgi:hypothetical protein
VIPVSMIGDALEYPRDHPDWIKIIGIGGLLNMFSFLILPSFLIGGYVLRVARHNFAGESQPPEFDDWGELFKDGLYAFLIGLIYSIPIIIMFAIGFGLILLMFGGAALGGEDAGALAGGATLLSLLVFGVLGLVYFVYTIVMGYLVPISLCSYAHEGDLRKAFSVSRLKAVGTNKDYLVGWGAFFLASFLIQSIVGTLASFLIGFLLYPFLPFVYFYLSVSLFFLISRVYADELDVTGEPSV